MNIHICPNTASKQYSRLMTRLLSLIKRNETELHNIIKRFAQKGKNKQTKQKTNNLSPPRQWQAMNWWMVCEIAKRSGYGEWREGERNWNSKMVSLILRISKWNSQKMWENSFDFIVKFIIIAIQSIVVGIAWPLTFEEESIWIVIPKKW